MKQMKIDEIAKVMGLNLKGYIWVPEWVRYVAVDDDGALYGYEHPPNKNESTGQWNGWPNRQLMAGCYDEVASDWGKWYWEVPK